MRIMIKHQDIEAGGQRPSSPKLYAYTCMLVEIDSKVKLLYVSILVWSAVSIDASVVPAQLLDVAYKHSTRVIAIPTRDEEWIGCGAGDVSATRTNHLTHVGLGGA